MPIVMIVSNQKCGKEIVAYFNKWWNFPHCCQAINGQACNVARSSKLSCLNYKGTLSILLMVVADCNHKFITFDWLWFHSIGRNFCQHSFLQMA